MNVNLNISDSVFRNANQAAASRVSRKKAPDPSARHYPRFDHRIASPGHLVSNDARTDVTTVNNTKTERDALWNALLEFSTHGQAASRLFKLANAFGCTHYWEIPSSRIFEALEYIHKHFKPKAAKASKPAPRLHPAPAPKPEKIAEPEAGQVQDFLMLDYLEIQLSWLREKQREFANEAEVMEFVIRELKARRVKM